MEEQHDQGKQDENANHAKKYLKECNGIYKHSVLGAATIFFSISCIKKGI